jgi:uroporphyrin-III C-methyltransferase/precorrin-2 dehydrogenase/sirohydrochlorin ferrochelatase
VTALLGVDLRGRLVVVAGGGLAAARRTLALLTAGARVRVVAPQLCEDLAELAAAGDVAGRDHAAAPAVTRHGDVLVGVVESGDDAAPGQLDAVAASGHPGPGKP